jgi:hypothetical protein
MKKNSLFSIIMITFLFIYCSDKSSNPTDPEVTNYSAEIQKLYPLEVGKSFTYNVDSLDESTSTYVNIGKRTMQINNFVSDYYLCSQIYDYINSNLQSKIQITENSLEFMVDSSGISEMIPDSLKSLVTLELGSSFKVLEFPLNVNTTWDVYKTSVSFGTLKFNVFSVSAKYLGEENFVLSNSAQTVTSEKVQYTIKINIPNMANYLNSVSQTYISNVWFAENYGIVKIEGSSLFVNPITGNSFSMADSSQVIRQTLLTSN